MLLTVTASLMQCCVNVGAIFLARPKKKTLWPAYGRRLATAASSAVQVCIKNKFSKQHAYYARLAS